MMVVKIDQKGNTFQPNILTCHVINGYYFICFKIIGPPFNHVKEEKKTTKLLIIHTKKLA